MTEIIDKKLIQRRRIMKYYIVATYKIMEEEGIDIELKEDRFFQE